MENQLKNYFKEHPVNPEFFMRAVEDSFNIEDTLPIRGKNFIAERPVSREEFYEYIEASGKSERKLLSHEKVGIPGYNSILKDKFAGNSPSQMGRKERRLAEKRGRIASKRGKKAYSRAEIGKIKDDAKQQVLEYNVEALFTCFALAQYRLFGHDIEQISQSLEYIDGLMGEVLEDKTTIEGLKKELEEATGVRIEC